MRIDSVTFGGSGFGYTSATAVNQWRPVIDQAVKLAGFVPEPLEAYARRAANVAAFKRSGDSDADIFRTALAIVADGGKVEKATADAVKAMAEADAIARLADAAGKYDLVSEYLAAASAARPILRDTLRPEFDKAAAALREHAPALDMDAPLDPAVIVRRNASDAYIRCEAAIDNMLTASELFGLPRSSAQNSGHGWSDVALRHLPAMVDPGKQTIRIMDSLGTNKVQNIESEPARKAVGLMWKDVTGATVGYGLDSPREKRSSGLPAKQRLSETLVRVAAGQYGHVVLSLAKDQAEVADRFEQIVNAMTTRRPRD